MIWFWGIVQLFMWLFLSNRKHQQQRTLVKRGGENVQLHPLNYFPFDSGMMMSWNWLNFWPVVFVLCWVDYLQAVDRGVSFCLVSVSWSEKSHSTRPHLIINVYLQVTAIRVPWARSSSLSLPAFMTEFMSCTRGFWLIKTRWLTVSCFFYFYYYYGSKGHSTNSRHWRFTTSSMTLWWQRQ